MELTSLRLSSQQISSSKFAKPEELVSWFGGMQSQDFMSSKWAIGLRTNGSSDQTVEQALKARKIVRTWPMRGTLHIVSAEDIRWMLGLTGPRIISSVKARHKELELDEALFNRSKDILSRELYGGKELTRKELTALFAQNGIQAEGVRLSHILNKAGMEQLLCFGTRKGSEFTYTLLDEWIPATKPLSKEESVIRLTLQYFQSRGPATLSDFIWWSGLRITEARMGLENLRQQLIAEQFKGETYWMSNSAAAIKKPEKEVYLLPAFDEYFLGYRDRSAFLDPTYNKNVISSNGIFHPIIVINGKIIGTWERTIKKNKILIILKPLLPVNHKEEELIWQEAGRFAEFTGLPIEKRTIK